jgi:hypothetical protein
MIVIVMNAAHDREMLGSAGAVTQLRRARVTRRESHIGAARQLVLLRSGDAFFVFSCGAMHCTIVPVRDSRSASSGLSRL